MNHHFDSLAAALDSIDWTDPHARQALYAQARTALFKSLQARRQPMANDEIEAEADALESAISELEGRFSQQEHDAASSDNALHFFVEDTEYGDVIYPLEADLSSEEFLRICSEEMAVPMGRTMDLEILQLLYEEGITWSSNEKEVITEGMVTVQRIVEARYHQQKRLHRAIAESVIATHLHLMGLAVQKRLQAGGNAAVRRWIEEEFRNAGLPVPEERKSKVSNETRAESTATAKPNSDPEPALEPEQARKYGDDKCEDSAPASITTNDQSAGLGTWFVLAVLLMGGWYWWNDGIVLPEFDDFDQTELAQSRSHWLENTETVGSQVFIEETETYTAGSRQATYCVRGHNRGNRVVTGLSLKLTWEGGQKGVLNLQAEKEVPPLSKGRFCAHLNPAVARRSGGDTGRIYKAMMNRIAMSRGDHPESVNSREFKRDQALGEWVQSW